MSASLLAGARVAAAIFATVAGAACHHRGAAAASAATAESVAATTNTPPDSVRGVVSVVGTDFDKRVMLQPIGMARPVQLVASTPADSTALMRLGGVEIVARGARGDRGPDALQVASFTAMRVGSETVADGVLRLDGSHVVLETLAGRLALGNPPEALRRMIGGRVWIAGPLSTGPNSYGLISPAR